MAGAIDLNCDLGEGAGNDAALMAFITSANIACGGHAGDDASMHTALALAARNAVEPGAHPGYPDRAQFGRVEREMAPAVLQAEIERQIGALMAIGRIGHVKPHGALYNTAARDPIVAGAIVSAIKAIDPSLVLFALSGSVLLEAGKKAGLRTMAEVFADRTYRSDGTLTPRSQSHALIERTDHCVAQAVRMASEGLVRSIDGRMVKVHAETLCLHGDGAHAVEFARAVRTGLEEAGIIVTALRP